MFGPIGMPELIIILVIALIIFGPRKLPELGKSLGRSLNEFKKASTDLQNTLEQEIKIEEQKEQAVKAKEREATAEVTPLRVDPIAPQHGEPMAPLQGEPVTPVHVDPLTPRQADATHSVSRGAEGLS